MCFWPLATLCCGIYCSFKVAVCFTFWHITFYEYLRREMTAATLCLRSLFIGIPQHKHEKHIKQTLYDFQSYIGSACVITNKSSRLNIGTGLSFQMFITYSVGLYIFLTNIFNQTCQKLIVWFYGYLLHGSLRVCCVVKQRAELWLKLSKQSHDRYIYPKTDILCYLLHLFINRKSQLENYCYT